MAKFWFQFLLVKLARDITLQQKKVEIINMTKRLSIPLKDGRK